MDVETTYKLILKTNVRMIAVSHTLEIRMIAVSHTLEIKIYFENGRENDSG